MAELIYADEAYRIIGACFNVYNTMGSGFLESVYQECLEIEFERQDIPFEAQKDIRIEYLGRTLKHGFQADFLCFGKIVVELKAVSTSTDEHRAQLLNYLHATGRNLGLLVNFGHHGELQHERFVL